jgi:hypothetical protein
LALRRVGLLRSPWLYQTDADATLPASALRTELGSGAGARLFPFCHVAAAATEERVLLATLQYEVYLRYHVLGLRWAGSPYAFHALGSCIVVHAQSYVQVRGFPKRAAGEDFYLLQKINKLAPVLQLTGEAVQIRARLSTRTPFGTGKAVAGLLEPCESEREAGLRFEAPASYGVLRQWLGALRNYAQTRNSAALGWEQVDSTLYTFGKRTLLGLGARERLEALLAETRGADLLDRAHTWFDGLKTQRFLHGLRDVAPPCGWAEALRDAPFVSEFGQLGCDPNAWRALSQQLQALESCSPTFARH